MPPNDELSRQRAKRFHNALMTLVEEEGVPYMSTMTLDMLDAGERANLRSVNQIFNPGPQHRPSTPQRTAPITARPSVAPFPQPNILNTRQPSAPSRQGSASSPQWSPPSPQWSPPSGSTTIILDSDDDRDEGVSRRGLKSESPEMPGKRSRGRPRKDKSRSEPAQGKGSESWKGVRDLEAIHLERSLEQLLRVNPSRQAVPFLAQCTLTYPAPTVQGVAPLQILAQLCLKLHETSTVSCIDHVRWLFQALVAGDMIFARFGDMKGSRVIGQVKSEVRGAAVRPVTSADEKAIDEMFAVAWSVHFICGQFRTGSLFWLSSRFTLNFLKRHVTRWGTIFEEMKANFVSRNFGEKIEQSGANQLGDAIRTHLRGIYNINLDDPATHITMVNSGDGLSESNGSGFQVESNDNTVQGEANGNGVAGKSNDAEMENTGDDTVMGDTGVISLD